MIIPSCFCNRQAKDHQEANRHDRGRGSDPEARGGDRGLPRPEGPMVPRWPGGHHRHQNQDRARQQAPGEL